MRSFGYSAGMAYQIKDDLLDYGYANVGKQTGNDIKEKKVTLPLIYALRQANDSQGRHILNLIKKKSDKKNTRTEVLKFVKDNGGIEYAVEKMNQYKDEALMILDKMPANESQVALGELINFMIVRQH
jgi:octaprenyl-diphosphate synthase